MLNTDGRLPKIGWYLGQESGAVGSDTATIADTIECAVVDGSAYGTDAKGVAHYTVSYQQLNPQLNANPLLRVDIVWGGSEDVETVRYDVDGNAIVNSAGQLYSALPQRPIRGAEVAITRRQLANPATMIAAYSYSTNASAIWGVSAENGLMGKIMARYCQEDTVKYWEVTGRLCHFSLDPHPRLSASPQGTKDRGLSMEIALPPHRPVLLPANTLPTHILMHFLNVSPLGDDAARKNFRGK